MNHLNDLLDDASAIAPPDEFELDAVIGAGRSRVRRRRAVAGIAAAAVAGLAATLVLPGDGSEPAPAAQLPQVSVLTLDDAVPAEETRDYQVLQTFTAHGTSEEMSGDFVRSVLPDGTVVATRYPNGVDGAHEVALIGPDGTRSAKAPGDVVNYLGATDRQLVFGSDTRGLWLLGLADLQWQHILADTDVSANQTVQPLTGNDGHIFVAASARSGEEARTIYDVDLASGSATELTRGGDVAAYGGRVAWTNGYDAPVRNVTVQDQTGAAIKFDPNTGDCVGRGLGITDQRVVVMTNCDDESGDYEYSDVVTRVDVFDLEGNPLTRITGDDMGPVRMADRYLTLTGWTGEREGTYTYDLESQRFLRVTDAMSGLAGNETGAGSTVVWEERLDGDTGARYVVAEMR